MAINKLTDAAIKSAAKAKNGKTILADGGGLHLRIRDTGSLTWFFVIRAGGKRREMGLGTYPEISLARARDLATDARKKIADGHDPIAERAASKVPEAPVEALTFGKFSATYISGVEKGWRNEVHRQQWRNSLRDHAASLNDKRLAEITADDVLAVLRPIWGKGNKPETASRVRGRIERILDAAKAAKHISSPWENPARWRGHLEHFLPRRPKKNDVKHHAALPFKDAPAFMASLRKRPALAARILEFVILSAARSGEALGATWGEVDFKEKIWTVPAERMKAGVEHVVPLCDAALALLEALRPDEPNTGDLIFAVGGAAKSNMAMAMLLRRMKVDVTTHGFRSTFRDWAGDATDFPRELIEQALAHTIENKAERAYRRGTAIERRRTLMAAWAKYLADGVNANVMPFKAVS